MSLFELNITNNNFNGPVNNSANYGNAAPLPENPGGSGHKKRQWWSGFTAELLKVIFSWLWENLIRNWLMMMVLLCLTRAGVGAEDAINWTDGLISLLTAILANLLK